MAELLHFGCTSSPEQEQMNGWPCSLLLIFIGSSEKEGGREILSRGLEPSCKIASLVALLWDCHYFLLSPAPSR